MTLLFLTAATAILTLAAICLMSLPRGEGAVLPPLVAVGISEGDSYGLLVILTAATGIGLVAWLSFGIPRSITRSLASCTRLARALCDGRFDAPPATATSAETAFLAASLNTMATRLQRNQSAIDAICGALTSIDGVLKTDSIRMERSLRRQESDMRHLAPEIARMEQSLKDISHGTESLLPTASSSSDSTRAMVAASERISAINDNLGTSLDEIGAAMDRMDAAARTSALAISDMLALSGTDASSSKRMEAAIRQAERGGQETRSIAEGITRDADTGRRVAQEAIDAMQAIRGASTTTAEAVMSLSRRAEDTDAILSVIEDMAEQTDLLALNATIIAAQAGDMGRDFSVVADEIRDLSERTGSSTREIAAIIHGIRDEGRRAVDAISQVEERIATGEQLARHASMALEMIVNGVQQAVLQMGGITRNDREQARTSQDIMDALRRIGELAQRIARASSEQRQLTELSIATLERMGGLSAQIHSLAREQRHGGALALQATGSLTNGIRQLRDTAAAAPSGSAPPAATLAGLQTAASESGDSIRALDGSLTALDEQIRLLKNELSDFSA
jgi:methyl-accepting chemotaxis protein